MVVILSGLKEGVLVQNIIQNEQFGFRKELSMNLQLFMVTEAVLETMGMVSLGTKWIFDIICYAVSFFNKMFVAGIIPPVISGVPQSSLLALFLIFRYDLPKTFRLESVGSSLQIIIASGIYIHMYRLHGRGSCLLIYSRLPNSCKQQFCYRFCARKARPYSNKN